MATQQKHAVACAATGAVTRLWRAPHRNLRPSPKATAWAHLVASGAPHQRRTSGHAHGSATEAASQHHLGRPRHGGMDRLWQMSKVCWFGPLFPTAPTNRNSKMGTIQLQAPSLLRLTIMICFNVKSNQTKKMCFHTPKEVTFFGTAEHITRTIVHVCSNAS